MVPPVMNTPCRQSRSIGVGSHTHGAIDLTYTRETPPEHNNPYSHAAVYDPHLSPVLMLSSQVSTLVFGGLHLLTVPGKGLLDEALDSRVSVYRGALEDEGRLFSSARC